MKVFDNYSECYKYITSLNLDRLTFECKINNIENKGITKINNIIIIVDEYGLLD